MTMVQTDFILDPSRIEYITTRIADEIVDSFEVDKKLARLYVQHHWDTIEECLRQKSSCTLGWIAKELSSVVIVPTVVCSEYEPLEGSKILLTRLFTEDYYPGASMDSGEHGEEEYDQKKVPARIFVQSVSMSSNVAKGERVWDNVPDECARDLVFLRCHGDEGFIDNINFDEIFIYCRKSSNGEEFACEPMRAHIRALHQRLAVYAARDEQKQGHFERHPSLAKLHGSTYARCVDMKRVMQAYDMLSESLRCCDAGVDIQKFQSDMARLLLEEVEVHSVLGSIAVSINDQFTDKKNGQAKEQLQKAIESIEHLISMSQFLPCTLPEHGAFSSILYAFSMMVSRAAFELNDNLSGMIGCQVRGDIALNVREVLGSLRNLEGSLLVSVKYTDCNCDTVWVQEALDPLKRSIARYTLIEEALLYRNYMEKLRIFAGSLPNLQNVLDSFAAIKRSVRLSGLQLQVASVGDAAVETELQDLLIKLYNISTASLSNLREHFESIWSLKRALLVWMKLDSIIPLQLRRDGMAWLNDHMKRVIEREIEHVMDVYQRHRMSPPITRGIPRIAGAISWLRVLKGRLLDPGIRTAMEAITDPGSRLQDLLSSSMEALTTCENVWVSAWVEHVRISVLKMKDPLVFIDRNGMKLHVSLQKSLWKAVHEVEWVQRLGIDVSGNFDIHITTVIDLVTCFRRLHGISENLNAISRSNIGPCLKQVVQKGIDWVIQAANVAEACLAWSSISKQCVIKRIEHRTNCLRLAVQDATDIKESLVESVHSRIKQLFASLLMTSLEYEYDNIGSFLEKIHRDSQLSLDAELKKIQINSSIGAFDLFQCSLNGSISCQTKASSADLFIAYNDTLMSDLKRDWERDLLLIQAEALALEFNSFWRVLLSTIRGEENGCGKGKIRIRITCDNNQGVMIPNSADFISESLDEYFSRFEEYILCLFDAAGIHGAGIGLHAGQSATRKAINEISQNVTDDLSGIIEGLRQYHSLISRDSLCLPCCEDLPSLIGSCEMLKSRIRAIPSIIQIDCKIFIVDVSLIKHELLDKLDKLCSSAMSKESATANERLKTVIKECASMDKQLRSGNKDSFSGIMEFKNLAVEGIDTHESAELNVLKASESIMLLRRFDSEGLPELDALLESATQSVQTLNKTIHLAQLKALNSQDSLRILLSKLEEKINRIHLHIDQTWESKILEEVGLEPENMLDYIHGFEDTIQDATEKIVEYEKGCILFGISNTDFSWHERFRNLINMIQALFESALATKEMIEKIKELCWCEAKPHMDAVLPFFHTQLKAAGSFPQTVKTWPAYKEYVHQLESGKEKITMIQILLNINLQERHWRRLHELLGCGIIPENNSQVRAIWDTALLEYRVEVEDLTSLVAKESAVQQKLISLGKQWASERLTFVDHAERLSLLLEASSIAELMEKLEDSIMTLNSLSSNRASSPFKETLHSLLKQIQGVEETMQAWLNVQQLWSYMESVFSAGDIAEQLPIETEKFASIDSRFVQITKRAQKNTSVTDICSMDNILEDLLCLLNDLECCQKSLSNYLETKRSTFPRFNFVSDSTLLEILSVGSKPKEVVKHLQAGIFDGIANLRFHPENHNLITHMISKEGEEVELCTPVQAVGRAEDWLGDLVLSMHDTMRHEAKKAAKEVYKMEIRSFVFSRPAQMALVGLQIKWTAEIQSALVQSSRGKTGCLTKALKSCNRTLSELVALTLLDEISPNQRTSLETCITVYMHQRDAVQELIEKRITDPRSFDWQKHTRFRWRDDVNSLFIQICDVEFEYGYEYLGVRERLVMTPLTDVCYVSLTQALGMYFGGAPAGPAGTGKTETTKDLGATLGKYVVVFNCSDQMDHHAMGRIFKGLAQAGFWGCFDEFNRINLDVLSVCAQQLSSILTALKDQKPTFVFTDGSEVPLNRQVGYFITMNPGYAGRQELPENLKNLFRGVTMMAPNRETIMRVKLAASGFQENEELSRKFNTLYVLCEQQLSRQPHYDFGLRNILSVLRSAGAAKRSNPHKSENDLIMKTLRDMNMSKFVAADVPIFSALLEDVFLDIKTNLNQRGTIEIFIQQVCEDMSLVLEPTWVEKCLQLYETTLVRHGIMVIGPPRSGKSKAIDVLASALTLAGRKTSVLKMNPKAVTAPQMFGRLDPSTGDWTDGIFSALWRKAARSSHDTWIVLDGPIDAVWIENLNTVLDDNKILTLANGDRIRMSSNMRLFFEAEDLRNASPATVSRAGIIYMSSETLGWKSVLSSFISHNQLSSSPALKMHMEEMVHIGLDILKGKCIPSILLQTNSLVQNFITFLSGFLNSDPKMKNQIEKSVASDCVCEAMENVILFCVVWGIGGTLDGSQRAVFSDCLIKSIKSPPEIRQGDILHDYWYDVQSKSWVSWELLTPNFSAQDIGDQSRNVDFSKVIVPTTESTRCSKLLDLIQSGKGKALIVGEVGTAKSSIMKQYANSKKNDNLEYKCITFSSLTTPNMLQTALESFLEKRQGRSYGPMGGKELIIVLDDLSMPQQNEWGDQTTNELTRQLMEHSAFYRLNKPVGEMNQVIDSTFIMACTKAVSEDIGLPNRLKGNLTPIFIPEPRNEELQKLFRKIIEFFSVRYQWDSCCTSLLLHIMSMTIRLWGELKQSLKASKSTFHYVFVLKDISRVLQGIINADKRIFRPKSVRENEIYYLWAHECARVFSDKLIQEADKHVFSEILRKVVDTSIDIFPERITFHPRVPNDGSEDQPKLFYQYLPGGIDECKQEILASIESAETRACSQLKSIVLFKDAIEQVSRISRVLTLERGSMLLVGVGGTGKRSLSRLAAFVTESECFQIKASSSYTSANLCEDLRQAFRLSGLKDRNTCFIISEADIRDVTYLDYINQFLLVGDIAGLFDREEMEAVLTEIRPAFREEIKSAESSDALYSFFIDRVNRNLHFVICISPVGDRLLRWTRQFPGLLKGCVVNWFLPWPEEALLSVASSMMSCLEMTSPDNNRIKPAWTVHQALSSIHSLVGKLAIEYFLQTKSGVYTTPRSYLLFIRGFEKLYCSKLRSLESAMHLYQTGLERMNMAKLQVDQMKDELIVKQQYLEKAQLHSLSLLEEIKVSTLEAEKERNKVEGIVASVTTKANEIAKVKEEAERDLEAAKPALEAALVALNSISSKDIGSLKSLRKPPDVIKRIMDCVLLLRHFPIGKTSWHIVKDVRVLEASYEESVKMMSDMNFLQHLLNFPKDAINDETVELLEPYFKSPDFNYESARKASGNVAGLCNWAEAMCKYHEVARDVEPKIMKLKQSEVELSVAEIEQKTAERDMDRVESALESLQSKFDEAKAKQTSLQDDAEYTQKKMQNAVTLITSLGGEEDRWKQELESLKKEKKKLIGDCLVASTFAAYLGPFASSHRHMYLEKIKEVCRTHGLASQDRLQAIEFLSEPAERLQWMEKGLPPDEFSLQNAAIIQQSSRVPFLIDPQGQGLKWLVAIYHVLDCAMVSHSSPNLSDVLENCVHKGLPMIVENVDGPLDSCLDSVLDLSQICDETYIRIGDKEMAVQNGFKLFLTTRLPNPNLCPEMFARTTVVNFTVSSSGLEDQFLNFIISRERSNLEREKKNLEEEVRVCRERVRQLESDLLARLSSSNGDILENEDLINVLADTKSTSDEITERLKQACETKIKITHSFEEYRVVATRAATLYFLLSDFSCINCMYKVSLEQFYQLFDLCISKAPKCEITAERVQSIVEELTKEYYLHFQSGLFERDKDSFRYLMTIRILQSQIGQEVSKSVRVLFATSKGTSNKQKKKPKDWLSNHQWKRVQYLETTLPGIFGSLSSKIAVQEKKWKAWLSSEEPERSCPLEEISTTSIHYQCLIRALREERFILSVYNFIEANLGSFYLQSLPVQFEHLFHSSSPSVPIICVISPGADPTVQIEKLAKKMKVSCLYVSMGQGQEFHARRAIKRAKLDGHWVCIQNAHLGARFLKELESGLRDLSHESAGSSYRLWVTTEPCKDFPMGILHAGIRVTCEPPSGFKDGLRSLVQGLDHDVLEEVPMPQWRPLLFSLAMMHVIIQERKKFGSIGWNVPYDFSSVDFKSSMGVISNHLLDMRSRKSSKVDWAALRFLIGVIQYGGRITDENDRVLMAAYCEKFFCDEIVFDSIRLLNDRVNTKDAHLYSFKVAEDTNYEHVLRFIEALPAQENPEMFGLGSSAEAAFLSLQSSTILTNLGISDPGAAGAEDTELSEEDITSKLKALIEDLPCPIQGISGFAGQKRAAITASSPFGIFYNQEISQINDIIKLVSHSLAMLVNVMEGKHPPSEESLRTLAEVQSNVPPVKWVSKSWQSHSLQAWFEQLSSRHSFLMSVKQMGKPKSVWFPGVINHKALFNTVLQESVREASRDDGVTIDQMELSFEVTKYMDQKNVREYPNEGIYLHGLQIEGGYWDVQLGKLVATKAQKKIQSFPVIHVKARIKRRGIHKQGFFHAPLYSAHKRTDKSFVTRIQLPCDSNENAWIMRGAALVVADT